MKGLNRISLNSNPVIISRGLFEFKQRQLFFVFKAWIKNKVRPFWIA